MSPPLHLNPRIPGSCLRLLSLLSAPSRPRPPQGESTLATASPGPSAPVPGGRNEGDPATERLFADPGTLELENGKTLPGIELTCETWDEFNAEKSDAVLTLHALITDAHVISEVTKEQATGGWRNEIVGSGRVISTKELFVLVSNMFNGHQGPTGPSSSAPDGAPWGLRFPVILTRNQIAVETLLTNQLGIESFSLIIGASLGGHRAIEWAVDMPRRVCRLIVITPGAHTTAGQAARVHMQLWAIELDPAWQGGDYYASPGKSGSGLTLTRQIAHTVHHSSGELDIRFGRCPQGDENPLHSGRLAIESYLDYHGTKIVDRFGTGSYVALTRSVLLHDAGCERESISEVLARITAATLVVAVNSDRLLFPEQLHRIAEQISGATYRQIRSDYGHDGFLLEYSQLTAIFDEFLGDTV